MKIKRLHASFGSLTGAELSLDSGLNIIEAPNEHGKSTWCAFIRTMLFGLNTADRDKIGHLADKTRYRPWNGSAMGGTMDLEHAGSEITLQRTSLGKTPMKKFSAVYTGTNEPISWLSSENTGEALTGMTEKVFERSAFIRQSGIRIDQTGDLERRIAALISTGEEDGTSYSEANQKLRAWQRKRQYNRSGRIPELQKQLWETEERLAALTDMQANVSAMQQEIEQLRTQQKALSEELDYCNRFEQARQLQKVAAAKAEAEAAMQQVKNLQSVLGSTPLPTDAEHDAIQNALADRRTLDAWIRQAEADSSAAAEAYDAALARKNNDPLSHFEASYILEQAAEAQKLQQTVQAKTAKTRTASIALLAVTVLAGIVGICTSGSLRIAAFAAAAICWIGAICAVFVGQKAKSALSALLSVFKMPSADTLATSAAFYANLCEAADAAEKTRSAAFERLESTRSRLTEANADLLRQAQAFAPDVRSVDEIQPRLAKLNAAHLDLERAKTAADTAWRLYHSLKENCKAEPAAADVPLTPPLRDTAAVQAALQRTAAQLAELERQHARAGGAHSSMGDPVVLGGIRRNVTEQLSAAQAEFDALTMAIATLDEANAELQSRFSPVLSRTAGEIYRILTRARYDSLTFDRDLNASARQTGEPAGHDMLYLSAGTGDQLYLALRLAICDLVSDPAHPCPIVLDDALVRFDDARMAAALDYLCEVAKTRQVILFTCHSREAAYLAGRSDVRIKNLH